VNRATSRARRNTRKHHESETCETCETACEMCGVASLALACPPLPTLSRRALATSVCGDTARGEGATVGPFSRAVRSMKHHAPASNGAHAALQLRSSLPTRTLQAWRASSAAPSTRCHLTPGALVALRAALLAKARDLFPPSRLGLPRLRPRPILSQEGIGLRLHDSRGKREWRKSGQWRARRASAVKRCHRSTCGGLRAGVLALCLDLLRGTRAAFWRAFHFILFYYLFLFFGLRAKSTCHDSY
jgi:hypothetical protein